MYAHFYHLAENPFNLTPDPKFHYINESTREAMAAILHGINSRKGFITLIGEAGTGKTTLLKRIVEEIEGETLVVFVFNPGVSFDELLEFICTELGITTDSRRRLTLLDKLNNFLLDQLTVGRNVVVMIDEAQTLEDAVLEELRLLSNLETSKEKILQILLSGQPELDEKLRRPGLRQLRQRIAVRANLKPMRADEIGAYVETRLRSAGAERDDFFTPSALRKIWHASKGIPRVINVICDNAMMIAFADGKRRITSTVTAEAIRDLQGAGAGAELLARFRDWLARPSVRWSAAAIVAAALVLPVALPLAFSMVSDWVVALQAQPEADRAAAVARRRAPAGARVEIARAAVAPVEPASPSKPATEPTVADASPAPLAALTQPRPSTADTEPSPRRQGDLPEREGVNGAAPARGNAASAPRAAVPVAPSEVAPASSQAVRQAAPVRAEPPKLPDPEIVEPQAEEPAIEESGMTDPLDTTGEMNDVVLDSIRRAEVLARATAARLFDTRRGSLEESAAREMASGDALSLDKVPDSVLAAAGEAEHMASDLATAPEPPAERNDPVRVSAEVALANESLADANEELADPLDSLAGPAEPIASTGPVDPENPRKGRVLGPRDGEPLVGRLVRVLPGDTVWDIAVAHYGTAGPVTLKRILNSNPRIRDPRNLEVGAHIYLPFQRPDQMVRSGDSGTYTVIVAVSPQQRRLEPVRDWMRGVIQGIELSMSKASGAQGLYQLQVLGLTSREAALALASEILAEYGKARHRGGTALAVPDMTDRIAFAAE